jgi:hypothetical protein
LAAGLGLAGAIGSARALPAGGTGVNVHGTVHGEFQGAPLHIDIDITVGGTESSLSGSGWDVDTARNAAAIAGACYFTQAGHLKGSMVHLEGHVLLSNTAGFLGAPVATDANLATGDIRWEFAGIELTGKGHVVRV